MTGKWEMGALGDGQGRCSVFWESQATLKAWFPKMILGETLHELF